MVSQLKNKRFFKRVLKNEVKNKFLPQYTLRERFWKKKKKKCAGEREIREEQESFKFIEAKRHSPLKWFGIEA